MGSMPPTALPPTTSEFWMWMPLDWRMSIRLVHSVIVAVGTCTALMPSKVMLLEENILIELKMGGLPGVSAWIVTSLEKALFEIVRLP